MVWVLLASVSLGSSSYVVTGVARHSSQALCLEELETATRLLLATGTQFSATCVQKRGGWRR